MFDSWLKVCRVQNGMMPSAAWHDAASMQQTTARPVGKVMIIWDVIVCAALSPSKQLQQKIYLVERFVEARKVVKEVRTRRRRTTRATPLPPTIL